MTDYFCGTSIQGKDLFHSSLSAPKQTTTPELEQEVIHTQCTVPLTVFVADEDLEWERARETLEEQLRSEASLFLRETQNYAIFRPLPLTRSTHIHLHNNPFFWQQV